MVDTYAVAVSQDKTHYVVCRNKKHYAVIDRKEGITKETKWKDKKILSSMIIKAGYVKLKTPAKYKGLKNK